MHDLNELHMGNETFFELQQGKVTVLAIAYKQQSF